MKLTQANTQFGVTFPVVEFEDKDVLELVTDTTKLTRITDCMNADRRQKKALVEARFDLASRIGAGDEEAKIVGLGFARLMETVKKDGEEVQVPAETEVEFFKRFKDALASGHFTPEGFSLPSGDATVKETAANNFLQTLASERTYTLDLEETVRKGGTGLVPKWALDAAQNIINNKSEAKWKEKFTNGYTSASGVSITPFAFDDFSVVPDHHATPEAKQVVHETNKKRLAKCLVEQRRQENAARSGEFA
jgi:hypothetical protein